MRESTVDRILTVNVIERMESEDMIESSSRRNSNPANGRIICIGFAVYDLSRATSLISTSSPRGASRMPNVSATWLHTHAAASYLCFVDAKNRGLSGT